MSRDVSLGVSRAPVAAGHAALLAVMVVAACGDDPVVPAAPTPCGAIPQATVRVGETSNVTACFNDSDGDVLTYSATSSNPLVATATVTGTAITITAVAPGNTTVTVTATDPGGLQGQQTFAVAVPNRPPQARGTLPGVTVQVGGIARIDVARHFSEPDGQPLSYSARLSNAQVASVGVAGSTMIVTGRAKGSATVTITATDPGGLSAHQTLQMTVPNRPPAAVGSIDAHWIEVGRSVAVNVAASFTDPDGDSLVYSASSSIAAVAQATVSGSAVTITATGRGMATITVTARDPQGESATQQMQATVPNRPPAPVSSIPSQTIGVGERATVSVPQYFGDPDGDALTYSATSFNSGVATVSVSGSAVTVEGKSAGTTTISVVARDSEGLSAAQNMQVTVLNRAPRPVGSIPGQSIDVGARATVIASQYFTDPDGDALTYSAATSNSGVVTVSVSGSAVTIEGTGTGRATITVTARDPEGRSANQQMQVTVSQSNRPPHPVGSIPAQVIDADGRATVDVSQYFSDPDGDALTYSATSSDIGIAAVEVFGATLELSGRGEGQATILVTATDPVGLSATQTFQVSVTGTENPPGSFEIDLRFATSMSASQRAAFESARARWMAILADTELPDMPVPEGVVRCRSSIRTYEETVSVIDDLMISAAVVEIDGDYGTIASAGPCGFRDGSQLPYYGIMQFDAADLDWMETQGRLEAVILHEMGHVLGIGTLWRRLGRLRNPSLQAGREVDTYLPLPLAIRAFDQVGGAGYTAGGKVPVENAGTRPGTDDGHWRKSVFGNELMNPNVEPVMPLSAVTIASLADLGYTVRMNLADAYRLPGAAALRAHQRRAIHLGDDVLRLPIVVRDRNGRVVRIIPP